MFFILAAEYGAAVVNKAIANRQLAIANRQWPEDPIIQLFGPAAPTHQVLRFQRDAVNQSQPDKE